MYCMHVGLLVLFPDICIVYVHHSSAQQCTASVYSVHLTCQLLEVCSGCSHGLKQYNHRQTGSLTASHSVCSRPDTPRLAAHGPWLMHTPSPVGVLVVHAAPGQLAERSKALRPG